MSDLTAVVLFFELLDARFAIFESLFVITATAVLVLALPGFVLHWLVLRRLRLDHAATWEVLGKPSVVFYGSIANSFAVLRFFRRAEYETLGDPSLSSVCRVYRTYATLYTGLFAATLAAFCLALVTGS